MNGAEYHELASWVKQRLDEVFPDDTAAGPAPPEAVPGEPRSVGAPADGAAAEPHPSAGRPHPELARARAILRSIAPPTAEGRGRPSGHPPAIGVDLSRLGERAHARLNAVFPDDAVPTDVTGAERQELFAPAPPDDSPHASAPEPPADGPDADGACAWAAGSGVLSGLRAMADDLQLGLLQPLEDYAQELERVQTEFGDDRHMHVLVQLQARLCRYMTGRFGRVHHDAVATLLKGFDAMERLAVDGRLSEKGRQRVVEQTLQEFKAFGRTLASPGTRAAESRSGRCAAARPTAPADPRTVEEQVREFQTYLRHEFGRLEKLLLGRLRGRLS